MRNISERLSNVSKFAQLVNYTQASSVQPSISEDTKTSLDLIETDQQCKHPLPPNPISEQLLFFDEESDLWIWSETRRGTEVQMRKLEESEFSQVVWGSSGAIGKKLAAKGYNLGKSGFSGFIFIVVMDEEESPSHSGKCLFMTSW